MYWDRKWFRRMCFFATSAFTAAILPLSAGKVYAAEKQSAAQQELSGYEKLLETGKAVYYFRDDRDIIAVYDKEAGYLWKTGLDIESAKDIQSAVLSVEGEELARLTEKPIEANMNESFTNMANSLVTVEYASGPNVEMTRRISSASKGAVSELSQVSEDTFLLDIDFHEINLQMKVYISFGEKEITYEIPFEELSGEGLKQMLSVYLTPFLGASGGRELYYNADSGIFDISVPKEAPEGYAFVPDGSGALIPFRDNAVKFVEYIGDVYGADAAQKPYYYEAADDSVSVKEPFAPVFGVAYTTFETAFVAYAESGDAYMQILCVPEENLTNYTWTCGKFDYNHVYHQVYNKAGDGYFRMMDEPNEFDIAITYQFLQGDGRDSSPAATYAGMAQAYRESLLERGVLEPLEEAAPDIPIRLDFIMSDVKKGMIGTKRVVVTTVDDVDAVLEDVMANGIVNINTGLYGWQKKGSCLSKPNMFQFSRAVGDKKAFQNLIGKYHDVGVDVSLAVDYVCVNRSMLNYYNTAVRHVNSWYCNVDKSDILPGNVPVSEFGYARPVKAAQWLREQADRMREFGSSATVAGIGSVLTSDYTQKERFSVDDAIILYKETLEAVSEGCTINIEMPGSYLWGQTDRFLQMPVGSTQYVFEEESVPFFQMVLYGTMEVYAPYTNFSLYTQKDILNLIDYNMYPSFILSQEPSHLLEGTNSADLYSTEYGLYQNTIQNVYGQMNEVLSQAAGYEWCDRRTVQEDVVVNLYRKGDDVMEIVVNYSTDQVRYRGTTIEPERAAVIRGR